VVRIHRLFERPFTIGAESQTEFLALLRKIPPASVRA
jgi:hypothetical protein